MSHHAIFVQEDTTKAVLLMLLLLLLLLTFESRKCMIGMFPSVAAQ